MWFLPKINKLCINIAGIQYPGTSILNNLANNEQIGYLLYKDFFTDEKHVPFDDWWYRHFKFRFDYRGEKGLFQESPLVLYEGGEDKINKDIWFELELKHLDGNLSANQSLKCFIYHHVPTEVIFQPGLLSWWMW